MKRLLVALAFLPALMGSTCLHTNGPTPPLDGGVTFTNCSDSALHAAELRLLPFLENAVASADYASAEAAITSIIATEALTVGLPLATAEASCAILWIRSKAQTSVTATADSLEALKVANAQKWLATHPVSFAPGTP